MCENYLAFVKEKKNENYFEIEPLSFAMSFAGI